MKNIKMFGIVVGAALTAMAIAGVGSASATSLCAVREDPCSAENKYAVGAEVRANLESGTPAELEAGFLTIECSESMITGKTTKAGMPIIGEASSVTFGNCNCGVVKATNLPYAVEVEKSGADTASLTGESSGKGNPGGEVTCAGVHCVYEKATVSATVETGSPARAAVETALTINMAKSDLLCLLAGTTATWRANYEVVSPNPVFVAREP